MAAWIPRFAVSPACPCCDEGNKNCLILFDRFNRADSENPGPNWNLESGDWDIETRTLTAAGAGVILGVPQPTGNGGIVIWVTIAGAAGAVASVLVGYTDDVNCLRADFTFGNDFTTGKITLSTGATATLRFFLGGRVRVCYIPGVAFGAQTWDGFNVPIEASNAGVTAPGGGKGYGLESSAGGARFADFLASNAGTWGGPEDPFSLCPQCHADSTCLGACLGEGSAPGAMPEQIDVEIGGTGLTTTFVPCCGVEVPYIECTKWEVLCPDLSGTYTVTYAGGCHWNYFKCYDWCFLKTYQNCAVVTDLDLGGDCFRNGPSGSYQMCWSISVALIAAPFPDTGKWIFSATIAGPGPYGTPAPGGELSPFGAGWAIYRSAPFSADGPCLGPWTLNKYWEINSAPCGQQPNYACCGTLPATITLRGV